MNPSLDVGLERGAGEEAVAGKGFLRTVVDAAGTGDAGVRDEGEEDGRGSSSFWRRKKLDAKPAAALG